MYTIKKRLRKDKIIKRIFANNVANYLLTLPSAAPEKLTQDKIKKIVYGLY